MVQLTSMDSYILYVFVLCSSRLCRDAASNYARVQVLEATEELYDTFLNVDYAAAVNLQRVQAAMAEENVGPYHFAGSTGYGHGDLGRAAYDQVCLPQLQLEPPSK